MDNLNINDNELFEIVEEINKNLKYKISCDEILNIIDVTDNLSYNFKENITENNYIEGEKFYCVLLDSTIDDRQVIEYMRSLIKIKKGYFFLYCKNIMELD